MCACYYIRVVQQLNLHSIGKYLWYAFDTIFIGVLTSKKKIDDFDKKIRDLHNLAHTCMALKKTCIMLFG